MTDKQIIIYPMKMRTSYCLCVCVVLFGLHVSFSHDTTRADITVQTDEADLRSEDVKVQLSGRAVVPGVRTLDWISSAQVLLDGGKHVGFLRCDGGFTVNDVPSGSFVLDISSPTYRFEPVRVDISSTGKIRARVVNYLKTSEVILQPYPLQMRYAGLHSYFIKRETWGWSDFLMNPMVYMMILPLLIILLLPKLMNSSDAEMRRVSTSLYFVETELNRSFSRLKRFVDLLTIQSFNCKNVMYLFYFKEMEQSMNMLNPNHELPDVSELMTKFFSPPKSQRKLGPGPRVTKVGAAGQRGGVPRRR